MLFLLHYLIFTFIECMLFGTDDVKVPLFVTFLVLLGFPGCSYNIIVYIATNFGSV